MSEDFFSETNSYSILEQLPLQAREWVESLPWEHRRYMLSLCYLMCAAPPVQQAEFLDEYTADGLVFRMLQDLETKEKVKYYLKKFYIKTEINESIIRKYIRQFYIHSAQYSHRRPALYLEAALRLIRDKEEQNNVFNYILGYELLKMFFKMSWAQQERLYKMQPKQEEFIEAYIKPIRHAHIINSLVIPKDKKLFFAKRNYYIHQPKVNEKKLRELMMATFPTDVVSYLGFSIIRHIRYLRFDYDYIFNEEPEDLFPIS